MRIYKCDRCGNQVEFVFCVESYVIGSIPKNTMYETKKTDLCVECLFAFSDWVKKP